MKIYSEINKGLLKASAAALGFFDGVHPGHQEVIKSAVLEGAARNIPSVLVTFKDHPRTLTIGSSPKLLTVLEKRLKLFAELGVDSTLLLSFSEELCRLSPSEYVKQVLIDCLGVRSVSIGYNHTFGRNRQGNASVLRELGNLHNFAVQVANPVIIEGTEVSSSAIRQAIESTNMELATKLLGRHYSVQGRVIHGEGRGQKIKFPTANLCIADNQLLPGNGVFAGIARLAEGQAYRSVINLGVRPTVSQENVLALEVHILNFDQNIYGALVEVEFWHHLRSEQKFANLNDLRKQISIDCELAKELLPDNGCFFAHHESQPA